MKGIIGFILCCLVNVTYAHGLEQELHQAEQLYKTGNKDAAKQLYIVAANQGSLQAHYALYYHYTLPLQEQLYHLETAAKGGHQEALESILRILFFNTDSLANANPQKALSLYWQAKKANPQLKLYSEKEILETLKMAVEAGDFNAQSFCQQYSLPLSNEQEAYYVWQIAEKASRGQFGAPIPKLILQLVSRGGMVQAELESAIKETYTNWKQGIVKEFNICDHVTSGFGQGFCAGRVQDEFDQETALKLQTIASKLENSTQDLLKEAFAAATKFIEYKANHEEGHGGTGRHAWIINSIIQQKEDYLQLIEKIMQGFIPQSKDNLLVSDKKLNVTYKKVLNKLKTTPKPYLDSPKYMDIRNTQRLWLPYRDTSLKLFTTLNSQVKSEVWHSFLNETREKELLEIMSA